jgi:hypothetical protein
MRYKIFRLGATFKLVVYKTSGKRADDSAMQCGFIDLDGEKTDNNLARAKSRIKELALCNDWSHFVTFTLDGKKIDRYDLDGYIKQLGIWIYKYNRKYGTKLKYLFIPEQHKDGAWHIHGLMNGLHPDSLVKNKHGYLDMPFYSERFGYISLCPVKSPIKVAHYITKYVSKAIHTTAVKLCKHLFYSSHGLKSQELAHEDITGKMPDGVYENDYVGVKNFDNYEELSAFIKTMQKEDERYETHDSDTGILTDTPNTESQHSDNQLLPLKPRLVLRLPQQSRHSRYYPQKCAGIRHEPTEQKHHVNVTANIYKGCTRVSDVVLQ